MTLIAVRCTAPSPGLNHHVMVPNSRGLHIHSLTTPKRTNSAFRSVLQHSYNTYDDQHMCMNVDFKHASEVRSMNEYEFMKCNVNAKDDSEVYMMNECTDIFNVR